MEIEEAMTEVDIEEVLVIEAEVAVEVLVIDLIFKIEKVLHFKAKDPNPVNKARVAHQLCS